MSSVESALEVIRRGTAEIISEENLKEKLERSLGSGKPLCIKLGIDPTAPDVHLGFAVVLRKLRQFQDLGHEVVIVIGDFTARIGDPTGRSETRKVLSPAEILENAKTYQEQFRKILDPSKTRITSNSEWLAKLNLGDLIELTSKYTVARMIERDDFQTRYRGGQPIGIHEFLYPLMQGYDSVALRADVELGGTDQKFNILVGRDLQREYGQEPQVALLMPILEGTDGVQKMSKSYGNYVGIREDPENMFGKLMSIPDTLICRYFELCTDVPLPEIREMERQIEEGATNPRDHKMRLAREIITIYHSQAQAEKAQEAFGLKYGQKGLESKAIIARPLRIAPEELRDGRIWIAALVTRAGAAGSRREAQRLVSQGAVVLDGRKVTAYNEDVSLGAGMILEVGKHDIFRIVLDEGPSS
ncbi:MAG: tyrosine--tRNA ligase [Armatimonadetes bacterium]|nr:tyrosine--tRNA ligase [Armatimonadota bacterium]